MEEAKQMLKNRRAYGIIYIPSDFSDNIAKGKQTQVSIYCDMSGLLYYKSMLLANTAVSLDMNRDIKIARSGNTTDRQDEITAYPIEYEEISIFNPLPGSPLPDSCCIGIDYPTDITAGNRPCRRNSPRKQPFQRPCTYQQALQRNITNCTR